MDLILFSEQETMKQRLVSAAQAAGIHGTIEICATPDLFYKRLRQFRSHKAAVVIAPLESETLEAFTQGKELLRDIRTIVICPDDEMETIVKAHLLRPRFVIFREDVSEKLSLLLTKMSAGRPF